MIVVVAGVMAMPVLALVTIAVLSGAGENWRHLVTTILPRASLTTLELMAGVGLLTAIIGIGTAWLTTMCRFPGRSFFQWALLVPLAVPTYIAAFTAVEMFDYVGPVQSAVRDVFGFQTRRDYWFPEIRSLPGAIFVLSFVLYPYVYMTTRVMFLTQSGQLLDVARTLGSSPWRQFLRIVLPLCRPATAVGVTLVMMECINDIGAVEFFGVRTLTFAVYDTWLNRSDLAGAVQLACVLLVFVAVLIMIERRNRAKQRFYDTGRKASAGPRYQLSPTWVPVAWICCGLPILIGFGIPAQVLLTFALRRLDQIADPQLVEAALTSFTLATLTAVLTVGVAATLALALRNRPMRLGEIATRIATTGYAVPGTVLAIGILLPLATLDNAFARLVSTLSGINPGLILTGSAFALIYAYSVRFLAVAHGTIESGLARVSPQFGMAARTLGSTEWQAVRRIQLPLLRPALMTAGLLVFVDTMKELPATILLRPFGLETLATTVYTAASVEVFEEGAIAALGIVLVGILPVILLSRSIEARH